MIAFDGEYVTTTSDVIYSDYQTTVMMKRQVMTILSNAGSKSESYSITVPVRATLVNATGTKLTDIISCRTLTVGSTGDIVTSLVSGMPQVRTPRLWGLLTEGMGPELVLVGDELYVRSSRWLG